MVPVGAMRSGKRKAEHQRQDSASKKAMEGYFRQAYVTMNQHDAPQAFTGGRCENSGEETDDDSEFSSLDERVSPSRPIAWAPAAEAIGGARGGAGGVASFDAVGHFGGAAAAAAAAVAPARALNGPVSMVHNPQIGMESQSASGSAPSNGNRVYHRYQEQLQQQQQLLFYQQQQQQQQHQQQQQQQQQQQIDGRRMARGGGARFEGDEWGWFVDAGEQEQQAHHIGPQGVRRPFQH